jgi:hypothetical protein
MRLLQVFLLILFIGSCNKEKLKAPASFFIQSRAVSVVPTSTQGSASHKITDLWLYVNKVFKGCYPVGSVLPVPSTGPTKITIYPGIKNNGISATRTPYEFYEPVEIDTALNPGVIMDRDLSFKYKSGTVFHYNETFNGGPFGVGFKASPGSDLFNYQVRNDAGSLDGNYMYFALDPDSVNAQFETTATYTLPANGNPVYIELNYKCDQPFYIGVFNGSDYRPGLTVNGSPNWNKIYVRVTEGVSTPPVYSKYGIFIKALKSTEINKPEFFIDNVKLISF